MNGILKNKFFTLKLLALLVLSISTSLFSSGCFEANISYIREFGTEGKGSGEFNMPTDIAVNSKGEIYICDTKNNRICVYNSNCEYVKSIGNAGVMSLKEPYGICTDAMDNIYVADTGNSRIIKFDPSGRFLMELYSTVKLGQPKDPNNSLKMPYDVAATHDGRIFVVDLSNRLLVYEPTGVCSQKLGGKGSGMSNFDVPTRVVVTNHDPSERQYYIYVADSFNSRVMKFNNEFKTIYEIKDKGMMQYIRDPRGLAILPNKSIILTDCGNMPIAAFTSQGVLEASGGSLGTGRGKLLSPCGVAVDVQRKKIYVSDQLQNKIMVYALHKETIREASGDN